MTKMSFEIGDEWQMDFRIEWEISIAVLWALEVWRDYILKNINKNEVGEEKQEKQFDKNEAIDYYLNEREIIEKRLKVISECDDRQTFKI